MLAVAVIFVENKHVLPKNMTNAVEDSFFACLLVAKGEKEATQKIVSSMYKDNMQIKKEEDLSVFYKVDPLLLQFLNTTGCHRRLALGSFADDFPHRNLAPKIFCYNNCFYNLYENVNAEKDSSLLEQELHDVTIRHPLRY